MIFFPIKYWVNYRSLKKVHTAILCDIQIICNNLEARHQVIVFVSKFFLGLRANSFSELPAIAIDFCWDWRLPCQWTYAWWEWYCSKPTWNPLVEEAGGTKRIRAGITYACVPLHTATGHFLRCFYVLPLIAASCYQLLRIAVRCEALQGTPWIFKRQLIMPPPLYSNNEWALSASQIALLLPATAILTVSNAFFFFFLVCTKVQKATDKVIW